MSAGPHPVPIAACRRFAIPSTIGRISSPPAAASACTARKSTWSRNPSNQQTTLSAQGCHPCLSYVLLPVSPDGTNIAGGGRSLQRTVLRRIWAEFPVKQGKYREFCAIWPISGPRLLPKSPCIRLTYSAHRLSNRRKRTGNIFDRTGNSISLFELETGIRASAAVTRNLGKS